MAPIYPPRGPSFATFRTGSRKEIDDAATANGNLGRYCHIGRGDRERDPGPMGTRALTAVLHRHAPRKPTALLRRSRAPATLDMRLFSARTLENGQDLFLSGPAHCDDSIKKFASTVFILSWHEHVP